MQNTQSKRDTLIAYDWELRKTIHKFVYAQEIEAQRTRVGQKAETSTRGIQQNVLNNPPRVVEENISMNEIIPSYRQPISPRDWELHPSQMMYEENDLYLDGAGSTWEIVLPALPSSVKFKITSTMIQQLNVKGMLVGATSDDSN